MSGKHRSGIDILADESGTGASVERGHVYLVRLKMWLNRGDPVRWKHPWGFIDRARLEDDGQTLISDLRVDRENLIAGIFYGIDGMCIGGTRTLQIAPHLAYGQQGVPGTIPENAVLTVDISFLEERRGPGRCE